MSLPSTFLSLAPATSDSYPQMPVPRAVLAAVGDSAEIAEPAVPTKPRSSSTSSGYKVLKLGPVHWGEHPDEHKEDFYEVAASP